jgi:hypothetical protein
MGVAMSCRLGSFNGREQSRWALWLVESVNAL